MADRLLVFDMDGVLVDVTESYRESIRQTVRHFTGREITPAYIQDLKNEGGWNNDWALSHKIIGDFGVRADYAAVVAYFQSIFFGDDSEGLVHREQWIAGPGLLEELGRRYRLSLFTGRLREEARVTLDRFATHLDFDPVICSDDVTRGKPHPEGLLKIASEIPRAELWYVGDTVDDARCAKAAGVRFIGIAAPGSPRRAELAALLASEGALAVLDDINQLNSVLPS